MWACNNLIRCYELRRIDRRRHKYGYYSWKRWKHLGEWPRLREATMATARGVLNRINKESFERKAALEVENHRDTDTVGELKSQIRTFEMENLSRRHGFRDVENSTRKLCRRKMIMRLSDWRQGSRCPRETSRYKSVH